MLNRRTLRHIAIHVGIWALYILNAIFSIAYDGEDVTNVAYETSVNFLISCSVFYLHASILLPRFFEQKRYKHYILFFGLLWAYNVGIRFFFGYIVDPFLWQRDSSLVGYSTSKLIIMFNWYFVQFCLYSAGYWFFTKHVKNEKSLRIKERIIMEHAVFKAQVNPHFLFNTLAHFQAETTKALPAVSKGILALSDLLRYSLDEPEADGMVSVDDEVHNIEQLILVYKQRYYDNIHIIFEQKSARSSYRIPPKILFTLVENSLKYGDLHDVETPIRITMEIREGELYFKTENNKKTGHKHPSSGIGLKFVRSSLATTYKNNHVLTIEETVNRFSLTLRLFTPAIAV